MERTSVQSQPLLRRFALLVILVVLAGWTSTTVAQLERTASLDETSGVWAGLAQYANGGTLYPALEAEGTYGGTRYMPIPIVMHAAASRLSGEYFVSGKALCALYLILAIAAAWLLGTRLGATSGALALATSAVLLTRPIWRAGWSLSPDLLAVALQLLALFIELGKNLWFAL
jgi:hypothetical protein